jgi:hypothetical protein
MTFLKFSQLSESVFHPNFTGKHFSENKHSKKGKHFPENQAKFSFD